MARFEVFIPSVSADLPVDLTLRVESENWLAALKVGLERICGARMAANVLCDVKEDGSVEVTDPQTGKVFRIVELPTPTPPPPATPVPPSARVAPQARGPQGIPAASPPAREQPIATPLPTRPPAPQRQPVAPRVEQVSRPVAPPSRRIGRTPEQQEREALLAEVFVRVARLHDMKGRDEGLAYLLDLAAEKVPCEAAFALLSRGDALRFAAGRGLKAAEVLKADIPIPVGTGIVGFCAQEVVCLAVSDVEKDPRFFRRISRAVGYETKSILCSPIVRSGRVFGAMELKNRKGGPFGEADLAVLAYLSHQAAIFLEAREAAQPL